MNLRRASGNAGAVFAAVLMVAGAVSARAEGTSFPATTLAAAPAGGSRNVSVTDPIFNMRAYSYTIPDNWIFDGAAVQGSSCAGGVVPVFRAISPDGLVGIKALPHLDWAWSDNPTMAKHDDAAEHDLEHRLQERRVHIAGADIGDRPQLKENHHAGHPGCDPERVSP